MYAVSGWVRPGFESVREVFAAHLSDEIGAACAIQVCGEPVVDLWGGCACPAAHRAWERDTIVPVFSVSKGVAAVCVLHLAQRELIDLDAPVSRYWPEFAQGGKGQVSVREAIAHRAGVPFLDGTITLEDLRSPEGLGARLAAQAPWFEPGSTHSYHAIVMGWITSELVRRVTGLPIGRWLAENISGPFRLALYMGLPTELKARVARLEVRDPEGMRKVLSGLPEGSPAWKALTLNGLVSVVPDSGALDMNDYALQAVEMAGSGMIGDARSLAAFYSACVHARDDMRLLNDETIEDAIRPVSTGIPFDSSVEGPSWGAGVMIPWALQPMLGATSFGHDGYGGNLAFADRDHRVGFAYVRNGIPVGGVRDPEVYAVVDALRAILNRN